MSNSIRKNILAFLLPAGIVIIDQITKYIVRNSLAYGVPHRILGEFLRLTYVRNPNTFFSISLGRNFPYTLLGIVLSLVLIVLILNENKTRYLLVYGLLLGGALGNIIDRITLGEVVDFIDIGISRNLRWPIFNIADSAITIGLILYFIIFLIDLKREEKDVE